jgi:hypothetical protein
MDDNPFIYCENCRRGYIGSREFSFIPSQHEGHELRYIRGKEPVKPKETPQPYEPGADAELAPEIDVSF